jgi:L-alanine-DL-glutamate epimerase-like enolase superfamily enzyme
VLPMKRRSFIKSLAAGAGLAGARRAEASLPKAKITRVRIYEPPNLNRLFNQSNMLTTVETDIGLTGVGEGGTKDTLEQCAGSLIGKNPFRIEQIWQEMFMAWFYPPGREKTHALGALDLALWDLKGKALKAPLHEILGGAVRDYCDCYATGGVRPPAAAAGAARMSIGDRARATLEAGYRVFRMGAADTPEGRVYDTRERIRQLALDCAEVRKAIGPNGEWMIDFHQRFDYSDALRGCRMIEPYDPFLVEDPVRDENALADLPKLRAMTSAPLAHGEEWGHRWEFHKLIENHDIDYLRATLPNVGGITEWLKVSALCATHAVGIVPHFTGPVATAALVHCLVTFPGAVLFEYNYGDRPIPYLPEFLDFKKGKLYPNDRPGLGVTLDLKPLKQIGEVTEPGRRSIYFRPDGSPTHW